MAAEHAGEGKRLLVVDDEPVIADMLAVSLRFVGFEVRTASSGAEAITTAARFRPDLLVLDVMLPDVHGFDVTRQLHQQGMRVPVVFLTALDATEDKVTGLTIGGDDYITKPFSLEEVVARIRAVLRRAGADIGAADDTALRFADLELDEATHVVRRAGELLHLSPTEFRLLHYLLAHAGKVLSKAQILRHVWDYDFAGDTRIVESYISMLRRKVDQYDPPLIHTVRGVGYSLRLPPG